MGYVYMKLWTIQPIEVLYEIEKKGYYICDKNKADLIKDYSSFKNAYDWLVIKMEERIGKRPKGVEYPVWAWYIRDWKNKKPDLRMKHGEKGQEMVCLELDINEKRVVLSDFDNWHSVLNQVYLDETNSEKEWDKLQVYLDSLDSSLLHSKIIKSWDRVFNVKPFENDWRIVGRFVQATFWVLYKSDIRKVQIFKSR